MPHIVRVLPDVSGIDSAFDYTTPDDEPELPIGTIVRVELQHRSVRGWVIEQNPVSPPGVVPNAIQRVYGRGPDAEMLALTRWCAWRWAGKQSFFLNTASPPKRIPIGFTPRVPSRETFVATLHVHGPRFSTRTMLQAWMNEGPCLVIVPHARTANQIAGSFGDKFVLHPEEWMTRGNVSVVGTRAAVFAPVGELARIIVLECHDEALRSERAPTWNAVDIAIERARRAGVPCELFSATPRAEDVARSMQIVCHETHNGWAPLHVIDLRKEDPHDGLYTPHVISLLRSSKRIVCVMNRKGRAQLLVCAACETVAVCETCGGTLQLYDDECVCARCKLVAGAFCRECGGLRLKRLRVGTQTVQEDLARLAGRAASEITGAAHELPDVEILIGTEAVLHRVQSADAVIFLDFDQELQASRFHAAEDALVLLGRASRLVSRANGVVFVQTRQPEHRAIVAAVRGDALEFAHDELAQRRAMRWPPATSLARCSGNATSHYVESVRSVSDVVQVLGPDEQQAWLLRSVTHDDLCNALAAVPRPSKGTLRVEVDPIRI